MASSRAFELMPGRDERAERFDFSKFSHADEVLLREMLKSVGCDERDAVYLALLEHTAAAEKVRAANRARRSRHRREHG